MSHHPPNPIQTLAIFLGASWFPRAPMLAASTAFYNSASGFRDYLLQTWGLPVGNVAWLFDDNRSPGDQLEEIADFLVLKSHELRESGFPPQDLIIFYVGHGLFSRADRAYCFA